MTGAELDALVAGDEALRDIDPNKASSDEELADWICEDLKIAKAESRGRTRAEPAAEDRAAGDRLAEMREQRTRR